MSIHPTKNRLRNIFKNAHTSIELNKGNKQERTKATKIQIVDTRKPTIEIIKIKNGKRGVY